MAVLQTNELLKENLSRKTGLHRLTDEETEAIKNVVLEAALDVIALCDENGIPFPEYIFTKDDGTPIHPDTFSKHLKALFAELGFPKSYHLHTLRHFFVSTLLHEGVDKNTVADLAGHGDTSFLERTYCHPQMQLKQEAAKRMSNSLFAAPNPELLVS